jgi:hypothetical protein
MHEVRQKAAVRIELHTSMREGTQNTTSLFVWMMFARYVSGVGMTGGEEGLKKAMIMPGMHYQRSERFQNDTKHATKMTEEELTVHIMRNMPMPSMQRIEQSTSSYAARKRADLRYNGQVCAATTVPHISTWP